MNNTCVYTCITGDYDNLIELKNKEKGIDYLCFTNNKRIKSKTWKVIYIEDKTLTDVQLARKTKILGNEYTKKYDVTIWMDGNQFFKRSIYDFLDTFVNNQEADFISFKHHARDCIYEEINACMQFKKEDKQKLLKLKDFYIKEKYPAHNGLIKSSIIVRKKGNELVLKTMKMWFEYLVKYTKRDQLTFNYCVFKTKMPIFYIDLNMWDNEWTGYYSHKSENKRLDFYRLYFGDSNDFEIEKCVDGYYKRNKDYYEFDIIIPNDTKEIELELSEKINLMIDSFEVKYYKKIVIVKFNFCEVNNNIYFYDKPIFLFKGEFKKGTLLKFRVKLKEFIDDGFTEFLEEVKSLKTTQFDLQKNIMEKEKLIKKQGNIIKYNENALKDIESKYLKIINSKSWKIIAKFQKLKSFMFK